MKQSMRNHIMDSVKLVCLLLPLLVGISPAKAKPYLFCDHTANFTTNANYATNRALLLSSLASNVKTHVRFYNATAGQDPDKIYGFVLCTAASLSEPCSSCVNSLVQDIIAGCPNNKEAFAWRGDPPCIILYANRSVFGTLELSPTDGGYNINNITSDIENFDQIWISLMNHTAARAATASSKHMYVTGEAELTSTRKIYLLMQCTPGVSQSDCSYCLNQSALYFQTCCHGSQGGYIIKPSCFYRWDLYPFYQPIADAPSPTPLPPLSFSTPSTNTTITKENKGNASRTRTVVIVVVPAIFFIALVALACALFRLRKLMQKVKNVGENRSTDGLQFDFGTIRLATNNFSDDNKLGQGGFGVVYKGRLPNGQAIAVKRLSRNSRQGEVEFKNEVLLVAKLQHRNLARLLGFCLEGKERLLIYEFVPNSSLDQFIFDPKKRLQINWEMRYKIIVGIARGILYLHEDSQLRIIHRDLKASNILLDEEMNPKISDFGMARLFALDQSRDVTNRIVGTYGYMPPEYAMRGQFSVKSDVFSFGVIVLEIISGKKVSCFRDHEIEKNLLTHVWRSWNDGTALNLIDPNPNRLSVVSKLEIMRCIHIGLLCVQENKANRPTIATVVLMLGSNSLSLPQPSKPAYLMYGTAMEQEAPCNLEASMLYQSKTVSGEISVDEVSITELHPR